MSAPQPALTPDFAVAQRELMLQGLERELEVTKKVLSTVPDSNRDFRIDSKSRTAGELAWHLVSSDVQMLDEIADHKFEMAPRFKQESRNIADLVNWYETNFLRAANHVRAMTPEQLARPLISLACSSCLRSAISASSATIPSTIAGNSPPACGLWAQRFLRSTAAAPTSLGTANFTQTVRAPKRPSRGGRFLEPRL